jgi:hypothetical protein
MADWVRCSSISDTGEVIWINLDQVARMAELGLGTEITIGGGQDPFVVREGPASILGQNIVRDA